MEYRTISLSEQPPLAVITLNRPDARNALNREMSTELALALNQLGGDDSIRCVIITGNDRAFCAGADVREFIGKSPPEMMKADHLRAVWDAAGRFPKPLLAAVSGYALGGGLELAMCCDIIIASEGAKLGQPEVNIGLIPGGGGTQRLLRAVGKYKAMEMILTGSAISAEEAKSLGLVNRVVPPDRLLDEARGIALEIASKGPVAVRFAKAAVLRAEEEGLTDGLEYESVLFHSLFGTKDKEEGMRAFLERRKPEFKGE
jgi:enoyl-CoA hydratase